jgi:hypothetical protein
LVCIADPAFSTAPPAAEAAELSLTVALANVSGAGALPRKKTPPPPWAAPATLVEFAAMVEFV